MSDKAILPIIAITIGIAFLFFLFSSKAVGVWHLFHLATQPQDLYAPIVEDNFQFYSKGYMKEYELTPNYRDIHEVIIASSPETIPSGWGKNKVGYEFKGKLKFELFSGGIKVLEKKVIKLTAAGFQDNDMNYYKTMSLYRFPVPYKGFSLNNLKIKITVIEPEQGLKNYKDKIELQVRVSPTP